MATLAEIQTRIDQIDALLAGGVRSTAVGGRRVEYDLEALRAERERLARIVSNNNASQYRRVVFNNA